jgi:hypothetical protein
MSKARRHLLAAALATFVPALAAAQSGQVGSITGYVFDEAGMPLKGIKVSATSPTQIGGARVAYTNDEGLFRILQLAPGRFEVRSSAPKMETIIHKDIGVGISSATEMNIVMKVQTQTEEIAVVEKAPLVVTTKANVKETFELAMVEALPHGSRDNIHNQMVNDVAGGMNNRVRGGNTNQTMFSQDGFEMRGQFPTLKSSAAYEVNTGGFGVDNPMASGGTINLVTKSGSNKFEFEFNSTLENVNQLRFFTDDGDNRSQRYFAVINPMVSGPIIRDRLWYMFNTETHLIREARDPDPEGIWLGTPESYEKFIQKGTLKLTWQVTNRNKLHSLTNFDSPHEWKMRAGAIDPDAQQNRHAFRLMEGLIWESLLSDSLVFRSQVGAIYIPQHVYPRLCETDPAHCDHIPRVVQKDPRTQEYGNNDQHRREDQYSIQTQNRLEYFLDGVVGDHAIQLKNNFYSEQQTVRLSRPGDRLYEYQKTNVPEQKTTYYSNDPRVENPRFGWWIGTSTSTRHTLTLSDAWRPTRYLTVTPAISHVYARGSNNAGSTVINASAFAPAVSVAWDATHDGMTVLRASYNNYVDINIFDLSRVTLGGQVAQRCKYNEGNGQVDADGEPFTKECEYSGGASRTTIGLPCGPTGVDLEGRSCRERLRIPRTHELTAGLEREVAPGIALALDAVYKKFTRQYATRESNRFWNQSGTALERNGSFRNGRNQTVTDLTTPEFNSRRYRGVTLTLRKREGRLKAQAAYTLSELVGADGDYGDNPGQDVFLYGYLGDDHRHEIRSMVTYQTLTWLSNGLRFTYVSGTPYNRNFFNTVLGEYNDRRAQLGYNAGVNINDPGDDRALRLPDIYSVNLQTRINLKPVIGQQLEFYVDILNLFAMRTFTSVTQTDGTSFGRGANRQGPMRMRLGLNYRY